MVDYFSQFCCKSQRLSFCLEFFLVGLQYFLNDELFYFSLGFAFEELVFLSLKYLLAVDYVHPLLLGEAVAYNKVHSVLLKSELYTFFEFVHVSL